MICSFLAMMYVNSIDFTKSPLGEVKTDTAGHHLMIMYFIPDHHMIDCYSLSYMLPLQELRLAHSL